MLSFWLIHKSYPPPPGRVAREIQGATVGMKERSFVLRLRIDGRRKTLRWSLVPSACVGQEDVHRQISIAIGRRLRTAEAKNKSPPSPLMAGGFPSGLGVDALIQWHERRPSVHGDAVFVPVVDVVFGHEQIHVVGIPGTGRSAAKTINLLSVEMLAPPQLVPALKGLVRGFPASNGASSPALDQEKSSFCAGHVQKSFSMNVRVKNSSLPSGEIMGNYSSSRWLTSERCTGAGRSACAWY